MSWSTLDWTGLWTGLDYSLSGIYCIGLPGSRLRHSVASTWLKRHGYTSSAPRPLWEQDWGASLRLSLALKPAVVCLPDPDNRNEHASSGDVGIY